MHSFAALHDIVNDYFVNYKCKKSPENLYAPVEYALSVGGKRIRPILVLMACEMFQDDCKNAVDAAAGIEIFHNFTLLHDDIMDHAQMRRGMPTVHARWNKNIALLSGDAMSIIAYQHIARIPERASECLEVFSDTALKICEGQQIDMDFETRDNVGLEDYIEMIRLKTGVLIACSLKIGAIAGGASSEMADRMYSIGINLGLAFQLQDDYLDVFGNPDVFGKNIGGDIVANKKTYLLVSALQKADGETLVQLKSWLSNTCCEPEGKIHAVSAIYKKLGVDENCRLTIAYYFAQAYESLRLLPLESERKEVLISLISKLEHRNY